MVQQQKDVPQHARPGGQGHPICEKSTFHIKGNIAQQEATIEEHHYRKFSVRELRHRIIGVAAVGFAGDGEDLAVDFLNRVG